VTLFRRLAIASTGATFLLMTIGGLVRATKSGLGCGTNWPHCPGDVTRALVIEFSHRATAGLVMILIGAMALAARKAYRGNRAIVVPATAAFGLVLFQALLGAVVVWLELQAISVVLHLGTALSLLALLLYLSIAATSLESERPLPRDAAVSRSGIWMSLAVFALLLVGSYVTGSGAGAVFPDWPLMNGSVVPDLGVESQAVHFAHRVLAAVTGIGVVVALIALRKRREKLPDQYRLGRVVAGLFAVEILIGAMNVWTELNSLWVTAHLAVAVAVFGSVVTLALISHPAVTALGERAPRGRVGRLAEAT
jgi:cytochrome c oxidase assembly protein subunit 15